MKNVPICNEGRNPNLSFDSPTSGEMNSDCDSAMPPTRAYSSLVALGKVEAERKWARKMAHAFEVFDG